ncbi:ODV-E26 [Dione juno nucleopolyhedrovirus]|uniref:ODV-E26 n=1 Tax=Dione juno nucleopolyhedrovirus TaxID=2594175 RepID=A0AAE6H3E3_9ABAC|nr:ODV-E26 [Dione juno nucleopolyhedrovirus]QDL57075.1 ODV-E26 [Dione juno nucleopolyhedrovirus]
MEAGQMLFPYAVKRRSGAAAAALCGFMKTVVTTTTVAERNDNNERITRVIAQLQKTRLDFSKVVRLQRKRVRTMQKLIRKKNSVIANLTARLDTRRATSKTKHFAALICKNVVHTVSGSEHFVRQRAADLCAAGGEQVFCARRANCARDRRRIAAALTNALGASVEARAGNRRFEIANADQLISAKLIIQQVLHNGHHRDASAH